MEPRPRLLVWWGIDSSELGLFHGAYAEGHCSAGQVIDWLLLHLSPREPRSPKETLYVRSSLCLGPQSPSQEETKDREKEEEL